MTQQPSSIVRFTNVVKRYPGAADPALDMPSFAIEPGEFFSLLGPSGSGKTTALRLIAGFERPDTGTIHIADRDVTNVPPNLREVNTVFQSYALFPHMTVRENVEYPLKMASTDRAGQRKRAKEALDLVAMADFADRYPHQMSGGQRQRVALARAFVACPKVLLLDEPLSALDLGLRQQMQHVLVQLQRELGITFLYVTHDQGEALSMSSRVAIMRDGVIQQLADPNTIYYRPSNKFVAQFIGKSNLIRVDVSAPNGNRIAHIHNTPFPVSQATRTGPSLLGIRFESLAIVKKDAPPPHAVCFEGWVSDVLFLGTSYEVQVKCGATALTALVPARRDTSVQPGEAVQVSFDPKECVLFHD